MKLHLTVILTFIVSFSAFGQTPPVTSSTPLTQTKESGDEPIKVNTVLLNVPVIASDRQGRNISGLTKNDFIITQKGERQLIEFFSDEFAPMNVAIVVDTSGSTTPILGNIKKAALSFLKVLRPEDKAMVVSFDGRVKISSELTSDQKKLGRAIDRLEMIQPSNSYMYDAIDEVINNWFATVKGRKAIIVLTDGFAGSNRITNQEMMRTLAESDTVIYPILFSYRSLPKNSPLNLFLDYAQAMALTSAGKLYDGGKDLQAAFQSIAEEMKKQYLIGFYPTSAEGGKSVPVKIEVDRKDVVIRTKRTIRLKTPESNNK